MRFLITALFFCFFLLPPAVESASADDYFKKAIVPEGAEERTVRVYPAFDFEDVIFTREYFYTLEEGTRQLKRVTVSPWTKLDVEMPAVEGEKETPPEPEGE